MAQRTRQRTMQNLPLEGIWKQLSQFYYRNRWTYKTRLFHFSNFISKTNLKNVFKFLQIKAIYIMHYLDFSGKN